MGEVRDKKCLLLAASMIKSSTAPDNFFNDVPLPNARIEQKEGCRILTKVQRRKLHTIHTIFCLYTLFEQNRVLEERLRNIYSAEVRYSR